MATTTITGAGIKPDDSTLEFNGAEIRQKVGGTSAANLGYHPKLDLYPTRIVTLMGGQDDDYTGGATAMGTSNCTLSVDETNYKIGDRGIKMTMAGAVTAYAYLDPPQLLDDPTTVPPWDALGAWVYIPDATKITEVAIYVWLKDGTVLWNLADGSGYTLANGWNLLRWSAFNDSLMDGSDVYQNDAIDKIRFYVTTNAATNATIGHVWLECPPKPRLLLISDNAYKTFYTDAYPDLKARNIPVTFAINPNKIETDTSGSAQPTMTLADMNVVAADGNRNAISAHSWNRTAMEVITAAEVRSDVIQCIKYIARKWPNVTGREWRAAWTQDLCDNASAARDMLQCYATPAGFYGLNCWPPPTHTHGSCSRWNIARVNTLASTQTNPTFTNAIDAHFAQWEATNGLMVIYVHGISAETYDTLAANWAYFLAKLDAVSGGYTAVVMADLLANIGVLPRPGWGGQTIEGFGVTGAQESVLLP